MKASTQRAWARGLGVVLLLLVGSVRWEGCDANPQPTHRNGVRIEGSK